MYGLGLRSLSLNFASTFGRQVGAGLLGLVTAAIIARVYGPEGNGLFALALLLPHLLGTLLNLGIASANVYFIGSGQVTVKDAVKANLHVALWLTIIGSFTGSGIIIWMGKVLFPGVMPVLLWLALLIYPITLMSGFLASFFQGLQDFQTYNRILIIQPVVLLAGVCLLAYFKISSLLILIGLQLFTNIVVFVFTVFSVLKIYRLSDNNMPVADGYSKRAIKYGWKANVGSVLAFINYKADIFLVNFFMSPVSAGIYLVAVTLAEKLWAISSAVSTVLVPRLSQLSSDEASRKRLTPLVSRMVLMVTLIASMTLAIMAYPLVKWMFGEQYVDSVVALFILLPGIIMLSAAKIWANDFAARGRPGINMYVALVTVFVNIIGNVLLIPKFGLAGAAAATTLAYLVCSVVTLIVYVRLTSNSWVETLVFSAVDMRAIIQLVRR